MNLNCFYSQEFTGCSFEWKSPAVLFPLLEANQGFFTFVGVALAIVFGIKPLMQLKEQRNVIWDVCIKKADLDGEPTLAFSNMGTTDAINVKVNIRYSSDKSQNKSEPLIARVSPNEAETKIKLAADQKGVAFVSITWESTTGVSGKAVFDSAEWEDSWKTLKQISFKE